MATTTNFGWATPDDTDLVKDGASAIRTLGSAIDTSLVDLKGGTTGQILSKASNTDMDFTWITAASGGGYELISEQTASANSGIDFNSISSSYDHLVLTWHGIYQSATSQTFAIRLNNSSATDYEEMVQYQETGSASVLFEYNTYTGIANDLMIGVNNTSTTDSRTSRGSIIIYNYASTSKTKYYEGQAAWFSANNSRVNFVSVQGYFNSTSAISSLNIVRTAGAGSMSNVADSSIRLYGVS